MALIDKMQSAVENLRNDDQRMNAGEIAALQQAYNAMQIGLIKVEFYIQQAQDDSVRNMLEKWRDDVIVPNLDKPRRMFEKAGIPYTDLNAQDRVNQMPNVNQQVFRDEDLIVESILTTTATIEVLQMGAITAVRGDIRDYFLNARDAAFDVWRNTGMVAYKQLPSIMPPTMTGNPDAVQS